MGNCSISHEEATIESFRKNRELAFAYLNDVLADGDQKECLLALRRVVEATGGFAQLARDTKLNEKSLHRALSPEGNPTLKSMLSIAQALGMQMNFVPKPNTISENNLY